jgi:hypothetical protein
MGSVVNHWKKKKINSERVIDCYLMPSGAGQMEQFDYIHKNT